MGHFPITVKPLLAFLLLDQFAFVFVYTSVLAKQAIKLHGGAKKMISLSFNLKGYAGWSSEKSRWKLAMYIEQFHTNNLNAVTYGKYAKISNQLVVKVLQILFIKKVVIL